MKIEHTPDTMRYHIVNDHSLTLCSFPYDMSGLTEPQAYANAQEVLKIFIERANKKLKPEPKPKTFEQRLEVLRLQLIDIIEDIDCEIDGRENATRVNQDKIDELTDAIEALEDAKGKIEEAQEIL